MSDITQAILHRLAEAVRESCIDEAKQAFEQGGLSGLCAEGQQELAVDRLRGLDLEPLVQAALLTAPGPSMPGSN